MDNISVIIVDDHKIFRDGFKLMLSTFSHINLIGEASDGEDFLQLIEKQQADLIFMDINMPKLNGIETSKIALERYPNLKIIALTTFLEEDYLEQMLLAGVEGYMLKNSELVEFEKAIEKVNTGGNYFSEEIVSMLAGNINKFRKKSINKIPEFTTREKEVLQYICKGYSNKMIAEACFLSVKTVEKHKTNLFYKTESINTVNLVIYAFKNKLADIK